VPLQEQNNTTKALFNVNIDHVAVLCDEIVCCGNQVIFFKNTIKGSCPYMRFCTRVYGVLSLGEYQIIYVLHMNDRCQQL